MKSNGTGLVCAPITGEPDGERGVGITAGWGWAGRGGAVPLWGGEVAKLTPGITQGGSVRASTLPKTVVARRTIGSRAGKACARTTRRAAGRRPERQPQSGISAARLGSRCGLPFCRCRKA